MSNKDNFIISRFRVRYLISSHLDMKGKVSYKIHLSDDSVFRFRNLETLMEFVEMNSDILVPKL